MRGEIVRLPNTEQPGLISGDDGAEYRFQAAQVRSGQKAVMGARVDFIALRDEARDVFIVPLAADLARQAPAPSQTQSQTPVVTEKTSQKAFYLYYCKCITSDYARFTGRSRRREYFLFMLFAWAVIALAAGLDHLLFVQLDLVARVTGRPATDINMDGVLEHDMAGSLALAVFALHLVPALAVLVRRLHDTGRSGWAALLILLPYAGAIILLVLNLFDSQKFTTEHGQSPKYRQA